MFATGLPEQLRTASFGLPVSVVVLGHELTPAAIRSACVAGQGAMLSTCVTVVVKHTLRVHPLIGF